MRLTAVLVGCSLPAEGGFLTAVRPPAVRTLEVAVEPGAVALRGGGGGRLLLDSNEATVSEGRDSSSSTTDLPTAGSEAQVVYSDVSVLTLSYSGLYDKPVVSLVVSVQPDVSLEPDVGVLTGGVLSPPEPLSVPDTKDKTRSVLTTSV